MPLRPRIEFPLAFALVVTALAASCSKDNSTAPNSTITGPTFSFTFPQTGTSHEFQFPDAGNWGYHCIPHGSSGMTGTVIVDASAASDTVAGGVAVGGGNGFQFVPQTVTIKPGGRVRWVNVSGMTNHTVTRP